MQRIIPITLLTGYLGAGKTTLLNYILNNQQGYHVAVIVNDIGEVNIDASLIAKGGVVKEDDGGLVSLQNGCICCSLKEDLMKQVADIANGGKFDYILIESSGVSEPMPIIQTLEVMSDATKRYNLEVGVRLDNVVSVVDAARLVDEFGSGRGLLSKDLEEDDIENLIIEQIEFCSKIIINKADTVSAEELDEVKAVVKALQPEAEILFANYGVVDLEKVLNTKSFDYEKAAMSATWVKKLNESEQETLAQEECDCHHHEEHDNECDCHHEHHHDCDCSEGCNCDEIHKCNENCTCDHEHHDHECHCNNDGDHECDCNEHHQHHDHCECGCHNHDHDGEHKCSCGHSHDHGQLEYGISTFVYTKRNPFNKQKFVEFVNNFPNSVIRCKGVVWYSDDEENMHMFEQAGKQKNSFNAGPWVASLPKEEQQMILSQNADIRADWKEDVGDRIIKLVFIGKNMDKHKIIHDLNECLE